MFLLQMVNRMMVELVSSDTFLHEVAHDQFNFSPM